MTGFHVDTKLFQELGQLLVAKESTALVELIKNAYDADATLVTVSGHHLDQPEKGRIVVSDDGTGMSVEDFKKGFLTVAGRTRNVGARRSKLFGRRYTGEKGVGRLAAHKLGTVLTIDSCKAPHTSPRGKTSTSALTILRARIDWNVVESLETFDQIDNSDAIQLNSQPLKPTESILTAPGTTLAISPLRSAWTNRMKSNFLNEVVTIVPHPVTHKPLPAGLLKHGLLFGDIPVRDTTSTDPNFEILFGGDLSLKEPLLPTVAAAASWIAEIEYDRDRGFLAIAIEPTTKMLKENRDAEGFSFKRYLGKHKGPSFRGRILQRSGSRWDRHTQGVRIFMEGFRVEPYGGSTDDWLRLQNDYSRRVARHQPNLARLTNFDLPDGLKNEELQMQSNAAYLGAIFLYRSSSEDLKMLVNREGFLSSPAFDFVSHWTRTSIDLVVRLGARYRTETKRQRTSDRLKQRDLAQRADVKETPTALRVRENTLQVQSDLANLQDAVKRHDYASAQKAARQIQPTLDEVYSLADQFGSEAVQWRVLASLGTELAAFVHEIHALGTQATSLAHDLEHASELQQVKPIKLCIRRARRNALELADRIRRNAAYLIDSTSFEGRRRRSRLPARTRFDAVAEFFRARIEHKNITIENGISEELRTPPMFPSEFTSIFMNLLSNAVKFTEHNGKISVRARLHNRQFQVQMDNTGTQVNLNDAARLFDAFHSTTEQPDATLGQGMGMGLTITRAFIREYGGEIGFVKPQRGYSTAIRFSVPTS